jgi:hypothetical protein
MSATEALFQSIESKQFSALVNVASNLKTFLRAADSQPEVRQLATAMNLPDVRSAVLDRVLELARREIDSTCENPWDAALAVYLWLLQSTDGALAAAAAKKIQQCPGCWWARTMAERVLGTGTVTGTLSADGSQPTNGPAVAAAESTRGRERK